MLDQALAVEGAEVRLGVADVDREQHGDYYDARGWNGRRRRALHGSPASPRIPARTGSPAMLMLKYKGIDFKRRDLLPVVSKGVLRVLGFPRGTVPAMKRRRGQDPGLA